MTESPGATTQPPTSIIRPSMIWAPVPGASTSNMMP
jgi:hypothetical protein